jgi:hypothetical protein
MTPDCTVQTQNTKDQMMICNDTGLYGANSNTGDQMMICKDTGLHGVKPEHRGSNDL